LQRLKLGTINYRPVFLKLIELYLSVLLMGKSGSGKTTTMAHWWYQFCFSRVAMVLIEPSGFLARDCYSISKGKSLYCSINRPLSLNPMLLPYDPGTISEIIAECINQLIRLTTPNQSLTVKMRDILDKAIKHCLSKNLTNLVHVRDHIVLTAKKSDASTTDGIIHRLNFLLNDERMLPILCGPDPIEWGDFIQKGQRLILDCSQLGSEKMIFVGNIASQGLKGYFRYQRPNQYQPLVLMVDECHNFVNTNFFDILKEGRKYKLCCILSTQDFSLIDEKLARVMLNTGTIVSYQVGHREASLISKEIGCRAQDLQNLEKYHICYMTPSEKGVAKALRPPIFKRISPPAAPEQAPKGGWFDLESYHPPDDYEHRGKVFADVSQPRRKSRRSQKRTDS